MMIHSTMLFQETTSRWSSSFFNVEPIRMGFRKMDSLFLELRNLEKSSKCSLTKELTSTLKTVLVELFFINFYIAQKITVADLLLLRGGVCISRPERAESDIDKAFLEACELQDLDQVKILVRQGANINVYDENKATGLQFAAYSGNHDLAEYLLNLGCDTRHENVLGDTAKYCALCQRHVEIVKMIEKAEQA